MNFTGFSYNPLPSITGIKKKYKGPQPEIKKKHAWTFSHPSQCQVQGWKISLKTKMPQSLPTAESLHPPTAPVPRRCQGVSHWASTKGGDARLWARWGPVLVMEAPKKIHAFLLEPGRWNDGMGWWKCGNLLAFFFFFEETKNSNLESDAVFW